MIHLKLIFEGTPEEFIKLFDDCFECDDCECDDEAEEFSEDEQKKINIVCDVAGAAAGAVANALRKHFD